MLHTHPPARHRVPFPVGPPTSKRIAIKRSAPAELLDDPVVGLVTMSDGVDRQTLELLARRRLVGGFLSGDGAECATSGLSEGAGDVERSGPIRIVGARR